MTDLILIFTAIPCVITAAATWAIRSHIAKKQWRSIMDYSRLTHHGYMAALEELPLQKCLADLKQARVLLMLKAAVAVHGVLVRQIPDDTRPDWECLTQGSDAMAAESDDSARKLLKRASDWEDVANSAYNQRKERGQRFDQQATAEIDKLRGDISHEARAISELISD
ncbi:hypothetical protein Q5738_12835 [Citrobacter werkmanii]|uniref:hypothetical protein n=1 Tax=Citrobacter werkmanii TaxID=67827 RepID=UPI0019016AB2|nr:hypothetical protein [Citrobacter werkmanii]MBJ9292903.1 hypothetical protein [Citrobacter werkmanii]MDO8234452.1 hypothetical protein [Citrobacter werkmanii]